MLQFLYYVFSFNSTQKKRGIFFHKKKGFGTISNIATKLPPSTSNPPTLPLHPSSLHQVPHRMMIGLGSRDACAEEALQQRSRGLPAVHRNGGFTVVCRRSQGRLFEQQRNPVGKEKAQSKFKRKTRWPHNLQEIKTIGNWK